MKSLVCISPGKFEYRDTPIPSAGNGYSLIRIKRIGICGTDLHAFEGTQPFFQYPRILGHEMAGEFISGDAEGFQRGDCLTIVPYFHCGTCVACRAGKENCCTKLQVCGVHIDGGMVEFLTVPSNSLLHAQGLSYDHLAMIEPLAIGAHGVQRAEIAGGEFVLVVGAGPIGLGTMEFARIAGSKVIALDTNNQRLKFCKDVLGISFTMNALDTDILGQLEDITGGDMPTVVIDATGNLNAINNSFQYLAHGGRYVLIGLQKGTISFSHPEFHKREATLMSSRNARKKDFLQVMNSIKNGDVDPTSYITHRVLFDDITSHFHSWLDPHSGVIKAMVEL
jgi:2-desacetyl-2-hydroxyethyl bacteriochlorophyllide A dehydrogenase